MIDFEPADLRFGVSEGTPVVPRSEDDALIGAAVERVHDDAVEERRTCGEIPGKPLAGSVMNFSGDVARQRIVGIRVPVRSGHSVEREALGGNPLCRD